jgi:hypothetical protein
MYSLKLDMIKLNVICGLLTSTIDSISSSAKEGLKFLLSDETTK